MDGKLQEAIDHYNVATQIDGTRFEPYQYKGSLEAETKQIEAAVTSYQQVMKKAPDGTTQLSIGLHLVELQKQSKQFTEASATYDRLLELHPPLANDKSFMKGVAKVKKKAGLV
jgi:tetratricopeptide (TPR) repeat protein